MMRTSERVPLFVIVIVFLYGILLLTLHLDY
jgi:hypothetical protein